MKFLIFPSVCVKKKKKKKKKKFFLGVHFLPLQSPANISFFAQKIGSLNIPFDLIPLQYDLICNMVIIP